MSEIRQDLHVELSTNLEKDLTKEDIEKIHEALKEAFNCKDVIRAEMPCYYYLDCDDEAYKCFLIYDDFKIYCHVCISDPENPEAIIDDFNNNEEDLNKLMRCWNCGKYFVDEKIGIDGFILCPNCRDLYLKEEKRREIYEETLEGRKICESEN